MSRLALTQKRLLGFVRFWARFKCRNCKGWYSLAEIEWDHWLPLGLGNKDGDDPLKVQPLCELCHKIKTIGRRGESTKASCADGDIHKIAKAKRLKRKAAGELKSKRPMGPSRGFDKSKTKRFDGKVVRRVV